MISFKRIGSISAGRTLLSDDIIEYHAARILMLILMCGTGDRQRKVPRIKGLTRLAKLDFFVRYPQHFKTAANYLNEDVEITLEENESKMIRHHYGPWDERYYQIIPYLESKNLLYVIKKKNRYEFYLTEKGKKVAKKISSHQSNTQLVKEMQEVNSVFKGYTGNKMKELIYKLFEKEVTDKSLGKTI